jgi:hypothetical protein
MRLQEFDLDIQYRKEKNSCNVDGLTRGSRAPVAPYGEEAVEALYDELPQTADRSSEKRNHPNQGIAVAKRTDTRTQPDNDTTLTVHRNRKDALCKKKYTRER